MKIRFLLLFLLFFSVSAHAINAPSNVTAVTLDDASDEIRRVEISWSAVDDASGYNIYRNNSYLVTVDATELQYLDAEAGESYYVVSFNSAGSTTEFSNKGDSEVVTPAASSTNNGTAGQGASTGFVFSRTDRDEYRWIATAVSGNLGSIRIDKACADQLGSVQSQGNWNDLMALAPEFDAIASPCSGLANTGNDAGADVGGYVFSRTDREEYRWIDTASDGTLGSVWIDKACADELGGVGSTGNWSELISLAPAFDEIENPCAKGTETSESTPIAAAGYVFSRTDRQEYRWIDVASNGGLGSIWIDQACADLLGPVVKTGTWNDLIALAPAFDAIDNPCDDSAGDTTGGGTTGAGNNTPGGSIIEATHGTIAAPPYSTSDPFGAELEVNNATPVAGGPTIPGNLRLDLLNNEWIQINWSPSVDDGEVVAYNIYRDGEKTYTIRPDDDHPGAGARDEIRRYWNTTSFIDCNYTHFGSSTDPLHNCASNRPLAGEQYTYSVTAVDNEGNESGHSNDLTARLYSLEGGSPIALYSDIYLNGDDLFPFATDFSNTNWLSQFLPVFSDEFNAGAIDRSKWNTELVWGSGEIINGEQQYFVNTADDIVIGYDPFKFTSNSLVIEAIKTPASVDSELPEACSDEALGPRCDFLSGALATHDIFGMTYGYVEGRMKVSGGHGALSSFYLYHRYPGTGNQFHSPEIDIVEYLGENQYGAEDAFHVYHYTDPASGEYKSSPTMEYKNPTGELFADDFHKYGVLWEPGLIVWYIDDKEIGRLSGPQIGRAQMNIVTYLVAGSFWAPTPAGEFPLKFEIDYIRAYQRPQYICNNTTMLAQFSGDQQACKTAFGV